MTFSFRHGAISALAAAGLGFITNIVTDSFTFALAIVAGGFIGVLIWLAYWQSNEEIKRHLIEARTARQQKLGALRYKNHSANLALLTASCSPTPLWGREKQLRLLTEWLNEPFDGVRILAGPPGVGKSRLALAVAEQLPGDWTAGWAHTLHNVVQSIVGCPEKALILVDDADLHEGLDAFLAEAAEHRDQIRVLLITRDGLALQRMLLPRLSPTARTTLLTPPIVLQPDEEGDRSQWFDHAVNAFSRQLHIQPPTQNILTRSYDDDNMLLLHARALLTAVEHCDTSVLTIAEIAEHLLKLEQGRWISSSTATPPAGAEVGLLTDVVAVLLLIPCPTIADAADALRLVPDLRSELAEQLRFSCARWARKLYPPTPADLLGVQPSVIVDYLIVKYAAANPDAVATHPKVALIALARAYRNFREALDPFRLLFDTSSTLLESGIQAVMDAGVTGRDLDLLLAELVSSANQDAIPALKSLPTPCPIPHTACALAAAAVDRARRGHDRRGLAKALCELSTRQTDLGRHHEALKSIQKSVKLLERSSKREQASREINARSLQQLSVTLMLVDRHREGLHVSKKSVAEHRNLAAHDPLFRDSLAKALSGLGTHLINNARYDEGISAHMESVAIFRLLAREDSKNRNGLAFALQGLGCLLGELARYREALPIMEECLSIYRQVCQYDLDQIPGLASANVSVTALMVEVGRVDEAILASEEAVSLFSLLASNNPGFRRSFALAFSNLGFAIFNAGRPLDAVCETRRCVTILRELVDEHPVYRSDLGRALANLGAQLCSAKQVEQSIPVLEEAVEVLRAAADDNPGVRGRIADALVNLGIALKAVGRFSQAVQVGKEAVAIFSAAKNAVGFRRSLAHAMICLGESLAAAGKAEDALNCYGQALAIQEILAKEDPDVHAADYRAFYQLIHRYSEQVGAHIPSRILE